MKKKQYNQVAGCFNYIFRSNALQLANIDSPPKWCGFRALYPKPGGQPVPDCPSSNKTVGETRLKCTFEAAMRQNGKGWQAGRGTLPSFKKTVLCLKIISLSDNLETLKRAHPGLIKIQ